MRKQVASGPKRFCAPRGRWVPFPTGLLILITWIIAGVLTYGQPVERWIDDPRPLSQAIDILAEQCRCVITYEDPQYEATQVVDVTKQVSRSPSSTNRVLVPKGTPFVFAINPLAGAQRPEDVVAASEALLDQFHLSGNHYRFRLDRSDTVLHVVPEKGSILQVLVSIPDTEASADEMFGAFLLALNKVTSVRVGGGLAPLNHLRQSTIRLAAQDEPAQQVLTRLLRATGRKVSWRLFYDYTFKRYFLNLHLVDPATCKTVDPATPCVVDLGDTLNAISIRGR